MPPVIDPAELLYFYSHAPCGARPVKLDVCFRLRHFYSHAPCGARPVTRAVETAPDISTHTPLAGRDAWARRRKTALREFLLTRPLRGATLAGTSLTGYRTAFLLTRPLRGATTGQRDQVRPVVFLLTRPLRGATRLCIS